MQRDLQPSLSSFAQLDSDIQYNIDDNSSNMKQWDSFIILCNNQIIL